MFNLNNIFISLRSLRAQRSNLDVASDEKRDCRALWARNNDDNFKTLTRHIFISVTLLPLSFLYGVGTRLHKMFSKPKALPRPVISVGNLTWGGTGKTPVVISLAQFLERNNIQACILSRGYLRKKRARKPLVVSDGKNIIATPFDAGDEPALIARSVPGAIVMSGADRFSAGMAAAENFNPGIFILDDGFQHWELRRNFDIICVNAGNPFGNGRLIPAGILREPVSALRRAQAIVITNADTVEAGALAALKQTIRRQTAVPLTATRYALTSLAQLTDNTPMNVSDIIPQPVTALSAIADNNRFTATLKNHGFIVERHLAFRDHHWFTSRELNTLLTAAANKPIVTTEKDAVRLAPLLEGLAPEKTRHFYAAKIRLEFMPGEPTWENILQNALPSLLTGTAR